LIEWNIQSRAHACQACSKPFSDQQPYHTMLFDEKLGYERLDVCEACWVAQYSQGATSRKGFVSHWQGVYEVPLTRPEPIQKANAESLLRKLVELNDPKYRAVCFILAVMLERKRVFKVRDQARQDGRRVFIYEQPATGDVFTITDPALQLNQLEEVQRDVAHLLEHGLNPPADAPTVPSAAGVDGNAATQPDAGVPCPATNPEERTVAW
jgi:hypothetical protein